MIRRVWSAMSLFFALAVAAHAEDAATALDRLSANVGRLSSLQAKFAMLDASATDGMSSRITDQGEIVWARQADKLLYRVEFARKMSLGDKGETVTMESRHCIIGDGATQHTIIEEQGEKRAEKGPHDRDFLRRSGVTAELRAHRKLRMLPNEKIAGRDCVVIEAVGEDATALENAGRDVFYFDAEHGVLLKSAEYDAAKNLVQSYELSDVRFGGDVPASRFALLAEPKLKLADRRVFDAFREQKLPGLEADIRKAAGFPVEIEVRWAEIFEAEGGDCRSELYEQYFTNNFFKPTAMAIAEVARDDLGRAAIKNGLKRIVFLSTRRYSEGGGVTLKDGVLTVDQRCGNLDRFDVRAKAIQKVIEAGL